MKLAQIEQTIRAKADTDATFLLAMLDFAERQTHFESTNESCEFVGYLGLYTSLKILLYRIKKRIYDGEYASYGGYSRDIVLNNRYDSAALKARSIRVKMMNCRCDNCCNALLLGRKRNKYFPSA